MAVLRNQNVCIAVAVNALFEKLLTYRVQVIDTVYLEFYRLCKSVKIIYHRIEVQSSNFFIATLSFEMT